MHLPFGVLRGQRDRRLAAKHATAPHVGMLDIILVLATVTDVIGGVGVPPSPPPPPVVTRRHNTRHKKTRSQIEPRRVPGGKQDNPSREACVCSRAQATTNSFFLFLGSPPGFSFTVTFRRLQSGPGGQSSCTRNDSSSTHQSKYHCPQEVPQSLLGVTIFSEKLFSHYGLLYFL